MKDILECVNLAKQVIEDKKGEKIKVLNIAELSPIADYFIVASGSNVNQLHAMSDEITEKLGKNGVHPRQIEGYRSANWILMDYGDFIIHLFTDEARDFYNLERVWGDAKTV
ncbi:MAG: ribosome silencing factor [Lachnospiraceae bacterium]|jgi:ribosome-associated protein|nr:ribosome silencing factor [Lachnospiraceae bacterium]